MPKPNTSPKTAQEILSQSASELFKQHTFKELALIWHPDHCKDPQANTVFEHLLKMRDHVEGKRPTVILDNVKMEYISQPHADIWVGQSTVVYKGPKVDVNLGWKFANDKMKSEMLRFLPLHVKDLGNYQVFRRQQSQILMSDLIRIYGAIPPVHVSWMVSRMLNLACYLNWSGISHCAFGPDNLLVDLEDHGVSLTGTMPFKTTFGQRPKAVPGRTFSVMPSLKNKGEVATSRIDLALIRQTALELFGDRSGSRIRSNPDIRPDIAKWLASAPPGNAYQDYQAWGKALGERKFVVFPTTATELYGRNL